MRRLVDLRLVDLRAERRAVRRVDLRLVDLLVFLTVRLELLRTDLLIFYNLTYKINLRFKSNGFVIVILIDTHLLLFQLFFQFFFHFSRVFSSLSMGRRHRCGLRRDSRRVGRSGQRLACRTVQGSEGHGYVDVSQHFVVSQPSSWPTPKNSLTFTQSSISSFQTSALSGSKLPSAIIAASREAPPGTLIAGNSAPSPTL